MKVKELTGKLLQEEFGDHLVSLKFWGPFEDEDLNVDVLLRERVEDLPERDVRIHELLLKHGFDVLIDYQTMDGRSKRSGEF
jgi:hypothetical protein